MKITNKYNLPEVIVKAVEYAQDDYDPGTADISVTKLISPAYQAKLLRDNAQTLSEDVSDRIWALQGTSVHYMIEAAAERMRSENGYGKIISERRYDWPFEYYDVNTKSISHKRVSAQIDLLFGTHLMDFKLTSVYAIKDAIANGKPEWDAQVNIQRYLLDRNSHEVERQTILAIARDWNKHGLMKDPNYPPRTVEIEIPVWTDEQIEEYVESRLSEHFSDNPEPCSAEETWERPPTFALMKKGRKTAVKVEQTEAELINWAEAKGLAYLDSCAINDVEWFFAKGYYIEERKGSRPRCEDYCPVSDVCPHYKEWSDE